jgi:hypothetical protein
MLLIEGKDEGGHHNRMLTVSRDRTRIVLRIYLPDGRGLLGGTRLGSIALSAEDAAELKRNLP